jgi:phosphotransferase system HPr (HPr) family protein
VNGKNHPQEGEHSPMVETQIQIINEVGLHLRPLHLFIQVANEYEAELSIQNGTSESGWVNAKSIIEVLTLAVEQNHFINLKAEGDDEVEALKALTDLIESDFEVE